MLVVVFTAVYVDVYEMLLQAPIQSEIHFLWSPDLHMLISVSARSMGKGSKRKVKFKKGKENSND